MKLGLERAKLMVNARGGTSEVNFVTGETAYIDMDTLTWRDQGSKRGAGKDSLNQYLQPMKDAEVNFFYLDILIISATLKHVGQHRAVMLYNLDMLFV